MSSTGRIPRCSALGVTLALLLAAVPALGREKPAPRPARASERPPAQQRKAQERSRLYVVGSGDTLGAIAVRFHVGVDELCKENGLSERQILRAGRTLRLPSSATAEPTTSPAAKASTERSSDKEERPAKKGERLAQRTEATSSAKPSATSKPAAEKRRPEASPSTDLAAQPRVGSLPEVRSKSADKSSAAALAKAAPADESSLLGAPSLDKRPLSRAKSGPSWLAYSARPKKRGYLELHSTVGRWSGQAVVDGWTIPEEARVGITRTLASWRSGAEERIHGRLIRLLARVSDQFGGRPIRIVSGYRPHAEARFTPHSKHTLGRAVDFSIPGIPNDVLRDYLRQNFRDVGIGYYPNSTHVHLDIREEDVYWVDYSSPGKAPSYGHPPRPRAAAATAAVPAAGPTKRASGPLSAALDGALASSLAALGPKAPISPTPAPSAESPATAEGAARPVSATPAAAPEPAAPAVPLAPAASAPRTTPLAPRSADSPSAHDTHAPEDP